MADASLRYAPDVEAALKPDLLEILLEAKVTEASAKQLAAKGIITVEAYCDLADSRTQVAQNIATPLGIDEKDAANDQPLKNGMAPCGSTGPGRL